MLRRLGLSVAPRFLWGWDRARTRQRRGGGFPSPPFRLREGCTFPPAWRFPRPPEDAGRPDCPGPVGTLGFSLFAKAQALVRLPLTPCLALRLVSRTASGDGTGLIKPATPAHVETAQSPQSLCPPSVLPPRGRRAPPPPRTLLPVPSSYGLRRQTLLAPPSFGYSPPSLP